MLYRSRRQLVNELGIEIPLCTSYWFMTFISCSTWRLSQKRSDTRIVTVAALVEAPTFIAIGRSSLEGCGFDSNCRPGSFLRFYSRPVMYSAVGSLASSGVLVPSTWGSIPARALDLIV